MKEFSLVGVTSLQPATLQKKTSSYEAKISKVYLYRVYFKRKTHYPFKWIQLIE